MSEVENTVQEGTECVCNEGEYCKPCNSNHWRDNFPNWTSGNNNIDNLIQESQLGADDEWKLLEWIEYSNLKDIEYLAEGDLGVL